MISKIKSKAEQLLSNLIKTKLTLPVPQLGHYSIILIVLYANSKRF
jgi:hypothetical protein